jgi:AcrR family transcriptional regulator
MPQTVRPSGHPAVEDSPAARRMRDAAVVEFARNGYGPTTTRDIASRLGLSAAAMYPHYRSKEELLYAISLDGHRSVLAALRSAESPTDSPTDRLRAVVSTFARWQAEHHDLARVVQYEIRSLTAPHYGQIVRLRNEVMHVLRDVLRDGIDGAAFNPAPVEELTTVLSSMCVDVCRWFPTGPFRNAEHVADYYGNLAVAIVSATPP